MTSSQIDTWAMWNRGYRRRTALRRSTILVCVVSVVTTGCARWRGYTAHYSSVPTLIEMLNDQRNYSTVTSMFGQSSTPQDQAALALVAKGKEAVMPLIDVLQHSTNSTVREQVAWVLGEIKDPRALKPIVDSLKDEEWPVRSAAAQALGEFKEASTIEQLIEVLKDSDSGVRRSAARALGSFPSDPRIVEPLISLLSDESAAVRQDVIHVLGKIHDPRVVPALIEAAKDKDRYIRAYAVQVLGETGNPQALDAIIRATEDEDNWVRGYAIRALREFLTDPRVVEPLNRLSKDSNETIRDTAKNFLALRELLQKRAKPVRLR